MGELCDHLRGLGLSVWVLEREMIEVDPRWSAYTLGKIANIPSELLGYALGCVKIDNRDIDGVLVFLKNNIAPPTYLYYYVVRANVNSLESKLKATFKSKWHDRCSLKPGFERVGKSHLEGEVSGSHWKGGELAQLLNSDSDLTQALYSEGLDSLEIRPDSGRQCVRILHLHWKPPSKGEGDILYGFDGSGHAMFTTGRKQFPTHEAFEAYDRIAYAIRKVVKAPVKEQEKG